MTDWTPEDQAAYERMQKKVALNYTHNVAKMDEANIPSRARRGFHKATVYGHDRIQSIETHKRCIATRKGDENRWVVVVAFSDTSYHQNAYIVGPRGAARKIY